LEESVYLNPPEEVDDHVTTSHGEFLISHPFWITMKSNVTHISVGFDHTLIAVEGQGLYIQGMGKQGELGLGEVTKSNLEFASNLFSWKTIKDLI
jgi:alpha-tubulin suppressor-like RCC1 family protein